ncbi:MAG: hypothetical protein CO140_02225 [Candidatus Moranbacteria bacterium CG_4_9_14_3_um_filter_40_7]|nr:MAG: hypothetical protein CO140_02225 [Candidatus Moranbacteria bacterium CG_4_9_14_3_um_filter_40_7]
MPPPQSLLQDPQLLQVLSIVPEQLPPQPSEQVSPTQVLEAQEQLETQGGGFTPTVTDLIPLLTPAAFQHSRE